MQNKLTRSKSNSSWYNRVDYKFTGLFPETSVHSNCKNSFSSGLSVNCDHISPFSVLPPCPRCATPTCPIAKKNSSNLYHLFSIHIFSFIRLYTFCYSSHEHYFVQSKIKNVFSFINTLEIYL